ncbi:MAG TPA: hypothetical protein VG894_10220, partial [Bauldia sp.]|nr:hypothetical protein [Bauldia sp.]
SMFRLVLGAAAVGGIAIAVAVLSDGPSSAESRLFSVRTDQPGVSVTEAVRNGKDLPVAGQNGGQTFFRIDNPSGAVPCANSILFTASNGQKITEAVDLCVNDWSLTIALGGGNPPAVTAASPPPSSSGTVRSATKSASSPPAAVATPPAATSSPPTPAVAPTILRAAAGTTRAVALATDDPAVTITGVFVGGQPVAIAAREDPYVQVNLAADAAGFACTRDLGLSLSDGRRLARQVDVCAANFVVVFPLVGGVQAPPLPQSLRLPATVEQLPAAPTPPVAALPPPSAAPPAAGPPATAPAMRWAFASTPTQATLAFAVPGSPDAGEFAASCQPGSGRAMIALTRTAGELGPGGKVWVTFTSGTYSHAFSATGGAVAADNLSHPVLTLLSGDPLWAALITGRTVSISIGTTPAYSLSLAGSATPVKQFLVACSPAAPQPLAAFPTPPAPTPLPPVAAGPAAAAVSFVCNDGSYISAAFGAASATVYEPNFPPLTLPEVPFTGDGRRFAAGPAQLVGQGEDIYWSRYGGPGVACQRAAG